MKTAHQLARELLAGPDLPIWHFDPSQAGIDEDRDTSLSVPLVQVNDPAEGLHLADISPATSDGYYLKKFITICGRGAEADEAVASFDISAPGLDTIATERFRQIDQEAFSVEHDDAHVGGELAFAAATYALPTEAVTMAVSLKNEEGKPISFLLHRAGYWPFEAKWFKPSPQNRIRELAKAGALIAAEIDRIHRVHQRGSTAP